MSRSFLLVVLVILVTISCSGGCRGSDDESPEAASLNEAQVNKAPAGLLKRASLPLCKVGIPYEGNAFSHTHVSVAYGSYACSLSSGSLPGGLTLDATGIISGTADCVPGLYDFTLEYMKGDDPSQTFLESMAIRVVKPGGGIQPCTAIRKDPRSYYVHQDAAMCGPTAFYMVMKFLGDVLPGAGPTNIDLAETVPWEGIPVLSSTSKIARYLADSSDDSLSGTDWSVLEQAAFSLRKGTKIFYPCIQSNPSASSQDKSGAEERATIFQNDLVPFLETNTPVIIHLKRSYLFSGHYVIVIGYERVTDEVLYLDPNNGQFDPRKDGYDADALDWEFVIQKVSRDEFIVGSWYQASGYPDARWDGKWLGFTH